MAKTILVVEDDPGVAELIRRSLVRRGYLCEVTQGAAAAFSRLLGDGPGVALLVIDYRLDGGRLDGGRLDGGRSDGGRSEDTQTGGVSPERPGSGLDFYKRLRAAGWRGQAVLITGFGSEMVLLEALRAGVTDVFPKTPDFVDPLTHAIDRILSEEERRTELELLKSEQRVHARVEAAFRAAQVSSWSWNPTTGKVLWAGTPLHDRDGSAIDADPGVNHWQIEISAIRAAVGNIGWKQILRMLSGIRRGEVIECEVPISSGNTTRWWLVRGTGTDEDEANLSGVAIDVTARRTAEIHLRESMEQVQQLNERLKFSITETHHRVKNSLQVVSSLLSIEFRRGKGLDESGLSRMIGHVRGLATLHDLLTDRSRDGRDLSGINVSEFLQSLSQILRRLVPHLKAQIESSSLELIPRRASSLALIVTELVMNAARHGSRDTDLFFITTAEGHRLMVSNVPAVSPASENLGAIISPTASTPATSIELVNTLLASDFATQLVSTNTNGQHIAYFNLSRTTPQERVIGAFH